MAIRSRRLDSDASASTSIPRVRASPTCTESGLPLTTPLTLRFFSRMSNAAIVSVAFLPGGWYLIPASHCEPRSGLKAWLDRLKPARPWNDSE
ncbi:hypothetical protein D3C72_1386280 [compost metagenome]